MLDFPDGKGLMAEADSTELTDAVCEKLRTRQSEIWSIEDTDKLPAILARDLKSESIKSIAVAPLASLNLSYPGILAIQASSRKLNA